MTVKQDLLLAAATTVISQLEVELRRAGCCDGSAIPLSLARDPANRPERPESL